MASMVVIISLLSWRLYGEYQKRERYTELPFVNNEEIYLRTVKELKQDEALLKYEEVRDVSVLTSEIQYTYVRNENIPLSLIEYDTVKRACEQYNFDLNLLFAVIYRESEFNHNNINRNNNGTFDIGLMQINSSSISYHISKARIYFGDRDYDVYDRIDNLLIGISVLIYNRDDWIKRGLVANSNELYYAILNTYNMGRGNREVGYIGYMTRTGKLSRAYDQRITETKNNLELKGIFD